MKYCCVPGCSGYGGHKFPKAESLKLKWRVAIKRQDEKTRSLWMPNENSVVCRLHFRDTDYKKTLLGDRSRLKDFAVPSIFSFRKPEQISTLRSERVKKRSKKVEEAYCPLENVQYEIEVLSDEFVEKIEIDDDKITSNVPVCVDSKDVQCNLLSRSRYSIENYQTNAEAVQYYTGFDTYEHFMMFFYCLGPAAYELDYSCASLHPKDELFLTMIKLRQCTEDFELSLFFEISKSTVSRIISTWINFLYFQLKELDIWPSKELIMEYMPADFFLQFPTTRVILDATEIPIQKPSNVESQSATWSNYKHKNTLKVMIGCTPKGSVSFISDAYGGSTSDRQIIERSDLVKPESKMFQPGDSIMADRGIMVQDLFANQDVMVNTPTMLSGRSQLEPEELVKDRRVASKRIHIERIIGLAKSYKILKKELCQSRVHFGSRIIYICFALTNFRNSIVDKYA